MSKVLLRKFAEGSENKRICSSSMINYIGGLCFSILLPLVCNCTSVVVFNAFRTEAILDALVNHKCHHLICYPQYLFKLLEETRLKKFTISSLRYVTSGATPVPSHLIKALMKEWSLTAVFNGYGMTESCCLNHINVVQADTSDAQMESIGKPLPNFEAKVVSPETGQIVSSGQDGVLLVRGPSIMKGYWDQPDLTKEFIDDQGWYEKPSSFGPF